MPKRFRLPLPVMEYGLIAGMPIDASLPPSFVPKTIAIVGKYQSSGTSQSLLEIAAFLQASNRAVVFETETARNLETGGLPRMTAQEIGHSADAVIVVGGDGTMLGIARQLAPYNVPLIGVNQGRLGF